MAQATQNEKRIVTLTRYIRMPRSETEDAEQHGDAGLISVHSKRNHVLAEFGRDALQHTDLKTLLDHAVLRLAQAIDVTHTKLMQYLPATADLLIVAGQGWRDGVVGYYRLRTDLASPAGCALQTAQPVTINDATSDPGFRMPALLVEHGIVSLCNVPIMADGKLWGVLEADSREKRHFTLADTDFLHAFASFLGAAIHRNEMETMAKENAERHAADATQVELLLRELQHRMKNNLQTILAVVSMQRRKAAGDEARKVLDHIANRVAAISLAQDQLSSGQRLRMVSLGAYLRALCAYLEPGREGIVVEAQVEDCNVPIDQAVPAGLIVNEAVTNALKHAFPDGRSGMIRVTFTYDPAARSGRLAIGDDGVGFDMPSNTGSGIDLMTALASQLGGQIQRGRRPEGGTLVSVAFPLRL